MMKSPMPKRRSSSDTAVDRAGLVEKGQIPDGPGFRTRKVETGTRPAWSSSAAEAENLRQLLTQSAQYGLELTKRNEELERKLAEGELETRAKVARVDQANRALLNHYASQVEEAEKQNTALHDSSRGLQRELDAARVTCRVLRTELEALAEKVAILEDVARSGLAKASAAARRCAGLEQEIKVLRASQEGQAVLTNEQLQAIRDQSAKASRTLSGLAKDVSELFSAQSTASVAVGKMDERVTHNEDTLSSLVAEAKLYYEMLSDVQSANTTATAATAAVTDRSGQTELHQEPEAFSVEQERAATLQLQPTKPPPRLRALSMADPMPCGLVRGVGFTASGFKYSLGLKYAALLRERNSGRRASAPGPTIAASVRGPGGKPVEAAGETEHARDFLRQRAANVDCRPAAGSGKPDRTYIATTNAKSDAAAIPLKTGEEVPRSLDAASGRGEELQQQGIEERKTKNAPISS